MVLPFDRYAEPSEEIGLVADRTSGSLRRADTVSSMGFLYVDSVSLWPFGAVMSTGVTPLAWAGSFSSRRSVAFWLSVPGSVRLSLRSDPAVRPATPRTTKTSTHAASTTNRWRTQNRPRP